MKKMLAAAATAVIVAGGGFAASSTAKADPVLVGDPYLQPAQYGIYAWGGHRYCWYYDAWRGPGWYWCGYPWRRGFGWGGGVGLEQLDRTRLRLVDLGPRPRLP